MDLRIKTRNKNIKKYSELIFREFQKNSLIKEKTDTVLYIKFLLCNFFLAASIKKTLAIPQDKNFYVELHAENHNSIGYRRIT